MIILVFIFFILLEGLFLPALIGPSPLLITQIFILALVIYNPNWKTIFFQALPFILVKEFFSGSGFGDFLLPFLITVGIYLWLNKFLNIAENLKENISFSGLALSIFMLAVLNYIYSWFFILHNTSSYNIILAWKYWQSVFSAYLSATLGWSTAMSILFKYGLLKK